MSMNEEARIRNFDREMMRSMFVSLFAAAIRDKKRVGKFTMKMLAESLGGANKKFEISRWFSGTPNWTLNTVADLAAALDLELSIEARERSTGVIYTPQGVKTAPGATTSESDVFAQTVTSLVKLQPKAAPYQYKEELQAA